MYYTTNIAIFFHVFHIFYYRNFDIGMFVLRSSSSLQAIKKIFEIINKRGWGINEH